MRTRTFFVLIFTSLLINACEPVTPALDSLEPLPASGSPQPVATPFNIQRPLSSPPNYSQNIRFERLSLEEGLSQSVVRAILQDGMGFLWIGTEDGLNRYDGYKFKIYRPDEDNPASISDRWITSMSLDPRGRLWIGTRFGGLNMYDPQTGMFTRFLHDRDEAQSIASNYVLAVQADKAGVWVGTESGLDFLHYDTLTIKHYRSTSKNPGSLSSNIITALALDPNNTLWVGTFDGGLNRRDSETDTFEIYKFDGSIPNSLSNNRVLSIFADKNGDVWVGTANGLNHLAYGEDHFTIYTHENQDKHSISGNTIYAVYRDHSNGLWVGTNEGLDRYDPKSDRFIHHKHYATVPNSLSAQVVYSIYEDESNVIWVGTYGGGLSKYNRQQDVFTYYRNSPDDPNSLSSNSVFPIAVDSNGIVWIGTYGGGLNRFNPTIHEWKHYAADPENPNSLNSDYIISLEITNDGIIWIGTARGLARLDPTTDSITNFLPNPSDPNSISSAPVLSIYQGRSGTLWVGTSRGLEQFDAVSQSFIEYGSDVDSAHSLSSSSVNAIMEDRDFSLWVGTFDDGLKRISNTGVVTTYINDLKNPSSIGSNSILSLLQDNKGNIWVGTAGGGLNLYDPASNSFKKYTEKDGLANSVVYGIVEDFYGDLWLSTNYGLSRFTPATGRFQNFTARDGLQGNEFNQNSYARDSRGILYFGGLNGINIFRPEQINKNPVKPKIVLTSITQDGKPIENAPTAEAIKEITITWPQNSFEFEFAALAYGQPGKNQYAYKLEGFDPNWNNIGSQRNGRYTNLPGGTYTLHLRGSNSDGVWNSEDYSITVVVVPPFWETWWFRVLLVIAIGLTIAGGMRWRVNSIESRNRQLETLVQRRTADLKKRTAEIEALYQADEKILRNVTVKQVFQTLVDVSVTLLKADRSIVFVWDEISERIVPRVSHGFKPETLRILRFNIGEGFVGKAMQTGENIIITDLNIGSLREDVQSAIRIEGIQSFAHFPIMVDGKVIAVFNVAYTRPNAINDDIVRLFTALIHRAELSIANMELFEQTKDLAVMEERNRLARDLHDSAKQKAFAALAQLGTANGVFKIKNNGIQSNLIEAENLVYEVIQELTFLIQEIYPFALQEKGLPTTLREYVFEWETRNDVVVNLNIQNDRPLELETEQAVYRIIQEALANIARHSHASRVDISLNYQPQALQVSVVDNGRGFDMEQKAKGMGLRSMRDRITSIRGTMQVQSKPGQGTRVSLQAPIKTLAGVETYETS